MYSFDEIVSAYRRQVNIPWRPDAPPSARIWILWHPPAMHLKLTGRIGELETITRQAGHGWRTLDLSPLFGQWIAGHEMFEPLIEMPQEVKGLLPQFETAACDAVEAELLKSGPNDILVLQGCGSLFGLAKLSPILDRVSHAIPGRLLVLFPGRHASGIYRMLDARDGWNYHAVPIPPDPLP